MIDEPLTTAPMRHEVQRVDDRTWIIRDRRLERSDPRSLVACVSERRPGDLELVWMHAPHKTGRYSSLAAAISEVERLGRRESDDRRPVPIPHLRPLRRMKR